MIEGENFGYQWAAQAPDIPVEKQISCEGLDIELLRSASLLPPTALQAPLASWMLSRLASETESTLPSLNTEVTNDGGGFVFDMQVVKDDETVAEFQLQGDTFACAMLGSCRAGVSPAAIVEDFIQLLLRAPDSLAPCHIVVRDPEWEFEPDEFEPIPNASTRNHYGWDGEQFLGADNVWSEFDTGQNRPRQYADYIHEIVESIQDEA